MMSDDVQAALVGGEVVLLPESVVLLPHGAVDNDGDDHVPCFLFEKLYKKIAELPINRPTGAEY